MAGISAWISNDKTTRLRLYFEMLDLDHSGQISVTEIQRVLSKVRSHRPAIGTSTAWGARGAGGSEWPASAEGLSGKCHNYIGP